MKRPQIAFLKKIKMPNLFDILRILPTDYEEYGGEIKRWADPEKNYPDCSVGCKYFLPLCEDEFKNDWGICCKKGSPRAGLVTWEHQAGFDCFEFKEEEEGERDS